MCGGIIGFLFGGLDGLFYALVSFTVIDYITGVLSAIKQKKLSSNTGAWGIVKKICIFLIVAVGHIIDVFIIGNGSALRTAVIFFYLANEGISIIENCAGLGVIKSQKLIQILEQVRKENENNE
jgi:toxin secretion/phage lysis holin